VVGDVVADGKLTAHDVPVVARVCTHALELLVRPTGRADNIKVSVPALVLHGDSDQTVPFEGSGRRTHEAIAGSDLYLIADAPHGCNVSHAEDFNQTLLRFLAG
jgi:pimeloyl-ACP methyl ester carboxylesterase